MRCRCSAALLLLLAFSAVETEAASVQVLAEDEITPLEALREKAELLHRQEKRWASDEDETGLGEVKANHGGSNLRLSNSPEQAQGAGVFNPKNSSAHSEVLKKLPPPFANDPHLMATLTPEQQQELLRLVMNYQKDQKKHLTKQVSGMEAKLAVAKAAKGVKGSQANAEKATVKATSSATVSAKSTAAVQGKTATAVQAKNVAIAKAKIDTAVKAALNKPKIVLSQTSTGSNVHHAKSHHSSTKANAQTTSTDTVHKVEEAAAYARLHTAENNYLADMAKVKEYSARLQQIRVWAHNQGKAGNVISSKKKKTHKTKVDKTSVKSHKTNIGKPSPSAKSQHFSENSVADVVANYQGQIKKFSKSMYALKKMKNSEINYLTSAEKKLAFDKHKMRTQVEKDINNVEKQSNMLGAISQQMSRTRDTMKAALATDMKAINTQLNEDEKLRTQMSLRQTQLAKVNQHHKISQPRPHPPPKSRPQQHGHMVAKTKASKSPVTMTSSTEFSSRSKTHLAYLAAEKTLEQIASTPLLGESGPTARSDQVKDNHEQFQAAEASAISSLPVHNSALQVNNPPSSKAEESHDTKDEAEAKLVAADAAAAHRTKDEAEAKLAAAETAASQNVQQKAAAQEGGAQIQQQQQRTEKAGNGKQLPPKVPDQALMQKQAEIAAEQKVAWEQKQRDLKNLQKEQKLVEQAEVRHAKSEKPPSEVAKASAEIQAEHVLAKEKAAQKLRSEQQANVMHQVNGPASTTVTRENEKTASKTEQKVSANKSKQQSPTKSSPAAHTGEKAPALKAMKALAKKAERLAEKTVVKEDSVKEEEYKHTKHGD